MFHKNLDYIEKLEELDVYNRLYRLMITVHKEIIPKLPTSERFNLTDQMRRASQAAAAMLAEGFPKRFQPRHWNRYITDALGETQEMIHHLSAVRDLYDDCIDKQFIQQTIDEYTICLKQLVTLGHS